MPQCRPLAEGHRPVGSGVVVALIGLCGAAGHRRCTASCGPHGSALRSSRQRPSSFRLCLSHRQRPAGDAPLYTSVSQQLNQRCMVQLQHSRALGQLCKALIQQAVSMTRCKGVCAQHAHDGGTQEGLDRPQQQLRAAWAAEERGKQVMLECYPQGWGSRRCRQPSFTLLKLVQQAAGTGPSVSHAACASADLRLAACSQLLCTP